LEKTLNELENFAGIDVPFSSYHNAEFVIAPIGYEGTACYKKGTLYGPEAILSASRNMELFDEWLSDVPAKAGIATLPINHLQCSPDDAVDFTETKITQILKDKKIPILLGGEHSLSIGAARAFSKHYNSEDISVLVFDAHADLRPEYDGSHLSHACASRRMAEYVKNVVVVGARSISEWEFKQLSIGDPSNVNICWMEDFIDSEPEQIVENIINLLSDNIYVSIDLDAFDPSVMPGVGTPEPGGLDWYTVLAILYEVLEEKNICGFDVVELSPIEKQVVSEYFAARLIYRIISMIINKKGVLD